MFWHIILMGYVFTTLMFSLAQPSWQRALIYLVFWTILPTSFAMWAALIRKRNKIMKKEEEKAAKRLPD